MVPHQPLTGAASAPGLPGLSPTSVVKTAHYLLMSWCHTCEKGVTVVPSSGFSGGESESASVKHLKGSLLPAVTLLLLLLLSGDRGLNLLTPEVPRV